MSRRTSLECMFVPKSVAVIGATDREGSVGKTVVTNLLNGVYKGKVFAINPKRESLLGLPCYKDISSLPEKPDLAVIILPAPAVPGIVRECVAARVGALVVISAGFKEMGPEGAKLEAQIKEELRSSKIRLIGPNCLGVMNPLAGMNATFAHDMAKPGNVALLSQSGALQTAILDWSLEEGVGFSAFVSTGSMLDVGWGDLIDYFGEDPDTHSILIYMESGGDARSFLSAAREVALRKPIIIIKAGRSEAASRAATSHNGSLTGSDEVFDAALRRCGVLRVQSIADLFHMAETLARQPRPRGPRLMILTNAGGPGVLATDALVANGGELATLSAGSVEALNKFLSPNWSHANPIDVLGDAGPEQYARALDVAIKDPESDGLLVVLTPQGMTDPTMVAEGLKPFARGTGKPVLASWMGGRLVAGGVKILNDSGIPTCSYPDTAARMFDYMWRYTYNLRGIYETPCLAEEVEPENTVRSDVLATLEEIRRSGRTVLTEVESKAVLSRYGIPVVETQVAHSEDEAVSAARSIGFPVVVKLYSETITHKTDVGGVKLNLMTEEGVRRANKEIEATVRARAGEGKFQGVTVQPMIRRHGYEVILGSSVDPQFGPVVLFGTGGQLVGVYKDRALALPPLNATLARRLMEQTHIYAALKGVRGRSAVNVEDLERILVRFGQLVVEQRWIKEIDINPLLASPEQIIALDARIHLYPEGTAIENLPRLAIRPYPMRYVWEWTTKSGAPVVIRPIRPEDEPLLVKFHATLSEQTVYLRYFHMEKLSTRVAHERLLQKCFIDYDREMALVVDFHNPQTGEHEIWAVGRLTRTPGKNEAEVAVIVSDCHQKQGLGIELLHRLIDVGRKEKVGEIVANILPENDGMRALAKHFDFQIRESDDPSVVVAALSV